MFLAWTVGAVLVSIPQGIIGVELLELLREHRITVLNCVPSLLHRLARMLNPAQSIFNRVHCGRAFNRRHFARFLPLQLCTMDSDALRLQ